jgi:hypothetical protein
MTNEILNAEELIETENTSITASTTTNSDSEKVIPQRFSFINTTKSANELKGLPILYIDPSNTKKQTVRFGEIIGIGPINIKIEPFNKFATRGTFSTLKAKELGLKFITLTGVDSEGNEVITIVQEDLVVIK